MLTLYFLGNHTQNYRMRVLNRKSLILHNLLMFRNDLLHEVKAHTNNQINGSMFHEFLHN